MCNRKSDKDGLNSLSTVATLVVGSAFVFCIFGYVYRHYFLRAFGLSIADVEISPFEAVFFAISQLADIKVVIGFFVVASVTFAAISIFKKRLFFTLPIFLPFISVLVLLAVVYGARWTGEARAREVIAGDEGRVIFCEASSNGSQQSNIWHREAWLPEVKLLMMTEEYLYVFQPALMHAEPSIPPQATMVHRSSVGDCYLDGYDPGDR